MKIYIKSILLCIFILCFGQLTASSVVSPDGKIGVDKVWPRPLKIEIYDPETEGVYFCSGTLIEKDVILTAAHCLIEGTNFYIQYTQGGAEYDFSSYGPSVKSYIKHPRFSNNTYVNDIGLIFLEKPIKDIPLSKIPIVDDNVYGNLFIMGWGEDQNGYTDRDFARYAALDDYSSKASKYFDNFNKNTMIAAGKFRPEENVFTGGCEGDSGGPLLNLSSEFFILVGITSFGAEDCNQNIPTSFTKVSFYTEWICSYLNEYSSYSNNSSCRNLSKSSTNVIDNQSDIVSYDDTSIYAEELPAETINEVGLFYNLLSYLSTFYDWILEDGVYYVWVIVIYFILSLAFSFVRFIFIKLRSFMFSDKTQPVELSMAESIDKIQYEYVDGVSEVVNKSNHKSNYYGLNRLFYNFREAGAIYCSLNVDKSLYNAVSIPIFDSIDSAVFEIPIRSNNENEAIVKISNLYLPKIGKNFDIYITFHFIF